MLAEVISDTIDEFNGNVGGEYKKLSANAVDPMLFLVSARDTKLYINRR